MVLLLLHVKYCPLGEFRYIQIYLVLIYCKYIIAAMLKLYLLKQRLDGNCSGKDDENNNHNLLSTY